MMNNDLCEPFDHIRELAMPIIRSFFRKLIHTSPALWRVSLLLAVYVLIGLVGLYLDTRTVWGANPWLKPVKFNLSMVVYLWTIVLVISELPRDFVRSVSKHISIAIIIVTGLVVLQAIRGVKTRFNLNDPLTSTIFIGMGISIAYNTLQLFRISLRLSRPISHQIPSAYLRGLQLGLYSIIIGSLIGHFVYFISMFKGVFIQIPAKAASPQSLTSWIDSLRIAHAMGLHFFQIFIVLGAILAFAKLRPSPERGLKVLNILYLLFVMTVSALIFTALRDLGRAVSL